MSGETFVDVPVTGAVAVAVAGAGAVTGAALVVEGLETGVG